MGTEVLSARQEWAAYWHLPLVAAVGYSTSGLPIYSLGAFLEPLTREFGWSRTEALGGAAIVSLGVAIASVPMGILIDRVGPRRVGLFGVFSMCASVALLGTATGTISNWILLWTIVAFSATMVQVPVWTTAVAGRFDAARGMAMGITLCGGSIPIFVLPLLTTVLVENYGWRQACMLLGALWGFVVLPVLAVSFRGRQDDRRQSQPRIKEEPDGRSLAEALGTPTLYKLMFAAGFFALSMLGLIVHFVPMLTDRGAAPMTAAGAAALIGIFALVGRLATGAVLDRFPGNIIGAISFILPVLGSAVLLIESGGVARYFVSASLLGLALGAETDVIPYLASRHFGLRKFGAIQGALLCAIGLGCALGPLVAGLTFDRFGSYTYFLLATCGLMFSSALLVATLRPPPRGEDVLRQIT